MDMVHADDLDDLSFTELLNMDLEAPGPDTDTAPAAHPSANMADQQPGVSSITRPRSRRGGPGTAPQGSSGPAYRLVPPHQSAGTALQVLFTSNLCNTLPLLLTCVFCNVGPINNH